MTWLTPYLAMHEEFVGHLAPKRAAAALAPIRAKHGDEKVLDGWAVFCESEASQYGPEYFARTYVSTWGQSPKDRPVSRGRHRQFRMMV